jgi:hypothetical protein
LRIVVVVVVDDEGMEVVREEGTSTRKKMRRV